MHAREKNRLISVLEAEKKKDYACPECGSLVRLRAGKHRHPHFYHLKTSPNCRLAKKGIIHLLLQYKLQSLLKATLEKPFPTIKRIADAFVGNTVYEVQYSPMSLEEAKARTEDYESLGLNIVWILHDHTYNKRRLRPVERYLRTKTCYYTNETASGEGVIYDREPQNPVDLTKKRPLPKQKWPEELHQRGKTWTFYHAGDLFDQALKGGLRPKRKRKIPNLKKLYRALIYSLDI